MDVLTGSRDREHACDVACGLHVEHVDDPVGQVRSTRDPACLLPSRYIEYMCDMVAEEPVTPHSKPILVKAVVMTPVPLFSKQRSGCRPFCEVYVGDERVTTTSQEYDKMRWAWAHPFCLRSLMLLELWEAPVLWACSWVVGLRAVGWRQSWPEPLGFLRVFVLSGSLGVISWSILPPRPWRNLVEKPRGRRRRASVFVSVCVSRLRKGTAGLGSVLQRL